MKMIKGQKYSIRNIERYANMNNLLFFEKGEKKIKNHLITLSNSNGDKDIDLLLTETSINGYIYECIHSDMEE